MYILVAFLGYFALAVVALLDKLLVSEEKLLPIEYAFYSTAPLLPVFALLPFGVSRLHSFSDYGIALVSGFTFGLALWTMYVGFRDSEVSHSGPLIGAAVPFFTLGLSYFALRERLTSLELVAVFILILGSLIISFEQTASGKGWHRGMLWVVASGFFLAISNVSAKYLYAHYGFYTGLIWARGAAGIFGVALLLSSALRTRLFHRPPANPSHDVPRKGKKLFIISLDKVLGVGGTLLVQYAVAAGSVSIVNALSGVQFALIIILVALASKWTPRLYKEDYAKGELVQEGMAVVLISLGVALLLV